MPANIFYGTGLPTCILVFKKCRKVDDNILFIDASQNFGKIGNQNVLRTEDIELIISTYRDRSIETKYSHAASLKEVEENDYNLNIPRYVDTFEAEGVIDLNEVSTELKAVEADMAGTDDVIAGFCKDLGINTPF